MYGMGAFCLVCCHVDSFYHNVLCPGDITISKFFRGPLSPAPQLLFGNDLVRRQSYALNRAANKHTVYLITHQITAVMLILNLILMCVRECGIMSLLCQVRRLYWVSVPLYLSIHDTGDDSAWKMTTRRKFSFFSWTLVTEPSVILTADGEAASSRSRLQAMFPLMHFTHCPESLIPNMAKACETGRKFLSYKLIKENSFIVILCRQTHHVMT